MLAWCVERGLLAASPAAGVKAPGEERARDRVLEPHEVAAIWQASGGLGWPFGALFRLLLLTGQRRDEVARMAWPDLDLDRKLWTLPRELTKADRVHEVPLPAWPWKSSPACHGSAMGCCSPPIARAARRAGLAASRKPRPGSTS